MSLRYQRERYADCIAEIAVLLPQHYAEVKLHPDQITLNLDDASYRAIEDLGNLVLIAARDDETLIAGRSQLIGYATVFLRADLHSAHTLAGYVDSYYLLPAYRRGWNGLKLFRCIEQVLKDLDVKQVFVGATKHMKTESLFRFGKYIESEVLYSKLL